MPNLPAVCTACGTIFPSGIDVPIAQGVTVLDCTSGPCPNCGGTGMVANIVNGVFELGKLLRIIPVRDLTHLKATVERVKSDKPNFEEARKEIIKAAPASLSIAKYLPSNATELYTFLTLLIALLTFIFNQNQSISEKQLERILEKTLSKVCDVQQTKSITQQMPIAATPKTSYKIGRNDPCPCGSGKKFKKCCLN